MTVKKKMKKEEEIRPHEVPVSHVEPLSLLLFNSKLLLSSHPDLFLSSTIAITGQLDDCNHRLKLKRKFILFPFFPFRVWQLEDSASWLLLIGNREVEEMGTYKKGNEETGSCKWI